MTKAIILAAGRGSRMGDLTQDVPKCFLVVKEKKLIEWQLGCLIEAGISDVAIVTGYRRDLTSKFGTTEFYNQQWSTTQMVSSLESAENWLMHHECIVSYSDIYYEKEVVQSLMLENSEVSIAYDPEWLALWSERFSDPLDDAETFRLDFDNNVTEIGARPKSLTEIQGQFMGLLKITPSGWRKIKEVRFGGDEKQNARQDMTGLLGQLIAEDVLQIRAVANRGLWGETDSPSDIKVLEKTLKQKR